MRIVEIEVEQLFGTFDHRIPLNADDRITLIHGPNGFGKTILLEMLYGLFNRHYEKLRRIPFRRLIVRFDDGTRVLVRQGGVAEMIGVDPGGQRKSVSVFGVPPIGKKLYVGFHNGAGETTGATEFEIPVNPNLETIADQGTWAGETYGQGLAHLRFPHLEEPSWWRDIQQTVRIEMIREQRLTRVGIVSAVGGAPRHKATEMPVITEHSNDLVDRLEKKLAESVALSQSLDRTFPARLLERIHANGPSENEITAKLTDLERKREQLQEAGILDEQEEMPLLPTENLADETRDMLAVYVEDAEKKLGVFEDLARKIELFQGIINSRFLYKKLAISRRGGFIVTTCTGEPLPLDALSSGEQQEMVLLYELLFRLEPDSLVLIDEPEISLDVVWQNEFLDDLAKITELASLDVLIATHSPELIHRRWDLAVELRSPRVEAEVETVP